MFEAEFLYQGKLHEAVGSISTNVEASVHETIGWIGLHVERKPKGKETYDIHPESFDAVAHIYRSGILAGLTDLFKKHINLPRHCRLEVSHRLFVNSLSDEPSLHTVLAFVDCIENAGVSGGARK